MFIIFRGLGFLVPVIWFVILWSGQNLTDDLFGGSYWDGHKAPRALCYLIASLVMLAIGYLLERRSKSYTLIHPETKEKFQIKQKHDFMFIKMSWWSAVLLGIAFETMYMS